MTKLKRIFSIYLPFTKAGAQSLFAYKVNFICFLVGEIMSSFIMYFVWKAVFVSSSESAFMGFTMSDMTVYLFVTFLTGYLTYSDGAFALGEEIISGDISMRMIKPIDFDKCFFFQELGNNLVKLSFIFIPILLGVEIYRFVTTGAFSFNVVNFLLYCLSTFVAYLIAFYFNICYGFLAFYLQNLWGTSLLKEVIIGFLSGATIPLAFLPPVLSTILTYLPFSSLSYTPVMIYMGMYDPLKIFTSFLLQIFWIVAFYILSRIIWNSAIKRLCANGG